MTNYQLSPEEIVGLVTKYYLSGTKNRHVLARSAANKQLSHIAKELKEDEELEEKVASRIIVDCGYDTEYPCPHAYPTMGYKKCPHLDEEVCMWQREQAAGFLTTIANHIEGEK